MKSQSTTRSIRSYARCTVTFTPCIPTTMLPPSQITYDGNIAHAGYRHLVSLITREERFNCISNLTVRETLMYMARLRLGGNTTDEQRAVGAKPCHVHMHAAPPHAHRRRCSRPGAGLPDSLSAD